MLVGFCTLQFAEKCQIKKAKLVKQTHNSLAKSYRTSKVNEKVGSDVWLPNFNNK
jgi:hypothetical protein